MYKIIIFTMLCIMLNMSYSASAESLVDKVINNPPPVTVIDDAKKMLIHIKRVSSMSSNVPYREFNQLSATLKAEFDIFKSEQRDYPEIVELMGIPVQHFSDASEYWYNYIFKKPNVWGADAVNQYKVQQGRSMVESLNKGRKATEELDNLFYKIKKKGTEEVKAQ